MKFHTLHAAIKPCNGTFIATLAKLNPKHDQAVIRISTAYSGDEVGLCWSVLVRVMMWTARLGSKGLKRAVVAPFQSIDKLPIGTVFDCSFGHSIIFGIGKN